MCKPRILLLRVVIADGVGDSIVAVSRRYDDCQALYTGLENLINSSFVEGECSWAV